jgi:hypothetical protein
MMRYVENRRRWVVGALTGWKLLVGSISQESFHADAGGCAQMHADRNRLNVLSVVVIGHPFNVLNMLRAGFLEKLCENAFAHDLRKTGHAIASHVASSSLTTTRWSASISWVC